MSRGYGLGDFEQTPKTTALLATTENLVFHASSWTLGN